MPPLPGNAFLARCEGGQAVRARSGHAKQHGAEYDREGDVGEHHLGEVEEGREAVHHQPEETEVVDRQGGAGGFPATSSGGVPDQR